jgi:hypothetical protein
MSSNGGRKKRVVANNYILFILQLQPTASPRQKCWLQSPEPASFSPRRLLIPRKLNLFSPKHSSHLSPGTDRKSIGLIHSLPFDDLPSSSSHNTNPCNKSCTLCHVCNSPFLNSTEFCSLHSNSPCNSSFIFCSPLQSRSQLTNSTFTQT